MANHGLTAEIPRHTGDSTSGVCATPTQEQILNRGMVSTTSGNRPPNQLIYGMFYVVYVSSRNSEMSREVFRGKDLC